MLEYHIRSREFTKLNVTFIVVVCSYTVIQPTEFNNIITK